MKKAISLMLAVVMIITLFTGCGKASMEDLKAKPETVVASIGDKDIYAYEMFYLMRAGASKEQALEELYTLKAMTMKAEENGITLEEEDKKVVADGIKEMKEQYGEEEFAHMLSDYYITEDQYVALMEVSQHASKFNEKITELELFKEATDEEISSYYDKNVLKAKHILISTVDEEGKALDDAKKAEKKKEAEDILKQIRDGADFDSLMAEKSEDPGSSAQPEGYLFVNTANFSSDAEDLMYFQQYGSSYGVSVMVKEFEQGTAALEIGEVSDLVESSFGYHIIKRLDTREIDTDFENTKEFLSGVINNVNYSTTIGIWIDEYEKKEIKKYMEAFDIVPYAQEVQEQQMQQQVQEQQQTETTETTEQ